jgi:hypothetical protein
MGIKKMSENPKLPNLQTKPKPIVLSFEYRRTGMGGFDDTVLISFKSGKVISSKLHVSKTGRHGIRTYLLFPAKYLMYEASRSNLGNIYINVKVIQLKENGAIEELQKWELYKGKEQKMILDNLPENIRALLINNKDELPLFYYIDQQPE